MNNRKKIFWVSFIPILVVTGNSFAQLTFPVPTENPNIDPGVGEEMTAYKTEVPPTINGDLSEWIDSGAAFMFLGDEEDLFRQVEWDGPDDCSIVWSMMWDEDSLYFGGAIWDDIFIPPDDLNLPWGGDCLWFYFDADDDGVIDNKFCLFQFKDGEPHVFYSSGITEGINLAVAESDSLGDEGRFMECSIPVYEMMNMDPFIGEAFKLQIGVEEGKIDPDKRNFVDWNGLSPDDGSNLFPVFFGYPVSVPHSTNREIPSEYSLEQNYPNPFNPVTYITFSIPQSTAVTLTVYDVIGKQIEILVDEVKSAGSYTITFDGTKLNSGIYFYKLSSENQVYMKKMTLIK